MAVGGGRRRAGGGAGNPHPRPHRLQGETSGHLRQLNRRLRPQFLRRRRAAPNPLQRQPRHQHHRPQPQPRRVQVLQQQRRPPVPWRRRRRGSDPRRSDRRARHEESGPDACADDGSADFRPGFLQGGDLRHDPVRDVREDAG